MSEHPSVFTLSNGLRVVIKPADGAVSYIGVAVNAGSRDEQPSRQGLAHFVEHTLFKGTRRRSSLQISNRMEGIGGELNAYTSKEETLIYTNAPTGNTARALELLADIISNSVFPEAELATERDVVVEEIQSYRDSAADSVYDDYEELSYEGSALAHNILGTPESVRSLTGHDCRDFIDKYYTPRQMVVYIVDSMPVSRLLHLAEKYFGVLHHPDCDRHRTAPPPVACFDRTISRDGHQAHTIVGARVFGRNDPRRFPLFLLNNYLGGPCMNSLLNQELREKRGLVYTVDSSVSLMSDAGQMLIYFGCDPQSVGRCRRLIANRLDALAQSPLAPLTFERIKRQYCGQLLVSSDHRESMAMSMAKSLLYYNEVHDIAATARRVQEVTPGQLREVAELVASPLTSTLTLL